MDMDHPLTDIGGINLQVHPDRDALGAAAAAEVADAIRAAVARRGSARVVFAAAPSQSEMLAALAATPDVPWEKVVAFHMDDYIGLPADAPQRFANWLDAHLFLHVPFAEIHRIPGAGDPEAICRDYEALLREAPLDVVCFGIGVNGHLAFNDPPFADFDESAWVKTVALDLTCRQQQVDDECFDRLDAVPTLAVTLTIPCLMSAGAKIGAVPGARKRAALTAALTGPVTTDCPASILQLHDVSLHTDREALPNG